MKKVSATEYFFHRFKLVKQSKYIYIFFFLIHFNVPIKIISLIEKSQSIGGAKREYPRENHLTHPEAELVLSHMWPVRGSNLHQSQW